MINSRDISKLHPYVMGMCDKFIAECKRRGIIIRVTSTLRDGEYQKFLYENMPGSTKTPLVGAHGFGLAFDVVPIVNGKAVWGDNSLWAKIGAIGKALGLEWGGEWKSIIDKPHFQYTQGLSGSELRAGRMPNFPAIDKIEERFFIMNYVLEPLFEGELISASVPCRIKPLSSATTNGMLKQGKHKVKVYAKVESDNISWYLVNPKVEQWVEVKCIKIV